MSTWKTAALGELAEAVDYGVTASACHDPIGPKFLRITDIQDGHVDWSSVPTCQCNDKDLRESKLRPGDIVFARTGATTGKSFLIRECPADTVFASYLIRVRLGDQLDPRFVAQFFRTRAYWAQVTSAANGAAQPGVNATKLKALKVPVPPYTEQGRIADLLEEVDGLVRSRAEALDHLEAVKGAAFSETFGEPDQNPRMWPVRPLGHLLDSATYGTSAKAGTEGAFAVLRMNNITSSGGMDFTDLKYMDLAPKNESKHLVRSGDILFNRTNSADLVGKTAIYRRSAPMAYAGYLVRLRVNSDNDPEYLAAFMNTQYAKRVLRGMCKSIIGMANINASEVQSIQVPVPPKALQAQFAAVVRKVEELKATLVRSQALCEELFGSVQDRAFRGAL